jgi:hypothetical protein
MDPELVWVTDDDVGAGASMASASMPSMRLVVSLALVAGLTCGAAIALVLLALGV